MKKIVLFLTVNLLFHASYAQNTQCSACGDINLDSGFNFSSAANYFAQGVAPTESKLNGTWGLVGFASPKESWFDITQAEDAASAFTFSQTTNFDESISNVVWAGPKEITDNIADYRLMPTGACFSFRILADYQRQYTCKLISRNPQKMICLVNNVYPNSHSFTYFAFIKK